LLGREERRKSIPRINKCQVLYILTNHLKSKKTKNSKERKGIAIYIYLVISGDAYKMFWFSVKIRHGGWVKNLTSYYYFIVLSIAKN